MRGVAFAIMLALWPCFCAAVTYAAGRVLLGV